MSEPQPEAEPADVDQSVEVDASVEVARGCSSGSVAPPAAEFEDESDDDMLGFNLFEGQTPKVVRRFDDLGNGIALSITCLDEEPIGVQSGQLLWPAAPALCRHLIASWAELRSAAVVELGAGCGMVGIAAAKLGCATAVLTDRDAGALELIEQNVNAATVDEQCSVLPLTWSKDVRGEGAAAAAAEHDAVLALTIAGSSSSGGYQLIVAADVIYDVAIPPLLFGTVAVLLATAPATASETEAGGPPTFLICQSFPYLLPAKLLYKLAPSSGMS